MNHMKPGYPDSPPPAKLWWVVAFEHGLVVEVGRCKRVNFEERLVPLDATTIVEASLTIPICLPEFKVTMFPDHSVPHIVAADPSHAEQMELWIVVEAASLLEATVKATGLLAQKKDGR